MRLESLVWLAALSTTANAAEGWVRYGEDYYSSMGCKIGVDKVAQFCGTKEAAKVYKCICKNENALVSWMECGKTNYPHVNFDKYVDQLVEQCAAVKTVKDFGADYLKKLYEDNVDRIVSVKNASSPDFEKVNTSYPITGPAVKKAAHIAYMSYYNRWQNINVSHYIGIAYLAFVGFILIASGIINWADRFNINLVPKPVQKYVTLGLVGKNHLKSNLLGVTPDMLETLFITVTVLYSFLASVIIGFHYVHGDPVFLKYQGGTSRYYGDRSAIISCYQVPLLFLFPGRNNLFQWVSRWKYSRFVTFHKWLARTIFLEILIHSFAMASQTIGINKPARLHKYWYVEGIAATVAGGFIIIFAFAPVRRMMYDCFLYIHIILVVQFLWLSWVHCKFLSYENYYWACIAIWCFDRFARLARIAMYGVTKTAEIQYYPGEEVIKVTVPESSIMKAHPGAHAFISFLTPARFFQSHPFTAYPAVDRPGYIHFTCRVKKGITKYIAGKAMASPDGKITMKVAIDGFYGEQSPFQNYDKVVLITGGTGLSGPFYHAKELSQKTPEKEIKLYWSVRTYQSIKSYLPELLSLKDTNVKPIIYVDKPELSSISTSSDDNKEKDSTSDVNSDDAITSALSFAEFRHGRLPASEIVVNEVNEANGSIAFGACAHPESVDEVRRTVASVVTSVSHRVDYYEEMQMW